MGEPAARECAPLAGPANAGEKRGQVESMEPGNTIPVFSDVPVLPNKLCRTGVQNEAEQCPK